MLNYISIIVELTYFNCFFIIFCSLTDYLRFVTVTEAKDTRITEKSAAAGKPAQPFLEVSELDVCSDVKVVSGNGSVSFISVTVFSSKVSPEYAAHTRIAISA